MRGKGASNAKKANTSPNSELLPGEDITLLGATSNDKPETSGMSKTMQQTYCATPESHKTSSPVSLPLRYRERRHSSERSSELHQDRWAAQRDIYRRKHESQLQSQDVRAKGFVGNNSGGDTEHMEPVQCNDFAQGTIHNKGDELGQSIKEAVQLFKSLDDKVDNAVAEAVKKVAKQLKTKKYTQDYNSDSDEPERDDLFNKPKNRRNRSPIFSGSSTPDLEESDVEEFTSVGSSNHRSRHRQRENRTVESHVRLPPFTGKESWKIWFNRFDEVAARKNWDQEKRLDELLPKLQGQAGEFVFGQLSKQTRRDYVSLTKELKTRFRIIETPKRFGSLFSKRNQNNGESVEEYAAELKRLYDKAHARRDQQTRKEDILRRFLDGLKNEQASFHVEYIKEPQDIDRAVYDVVTYMQATHHQSSNDRNQDRKMKNTSHRVARAAQEDSEEDKEKLIRNFDTSSDAEENHIARINEKGLLPGQNVSKNFSGHHNKVGFRQAEVNTRSLTPQKDESLKAVLDKLSTIEDRLHRLENNNKEKVFPRNKLDCRCFKCGTFGHFANECLAHEHSTTADRSGKVTEQGN